MMGGCQARSSRRSINTALLAAFTIVAFVSSGPIWGALTVTFDGVPVAPTSVTTTSFSIDVVPPAITANVPVVVTLSNSESASQLQTVENYRLALYTSTTYSGSEVGGLDAADAKCAVRALAAGLPGTYRAWLGDATGNPATRFTQHPGPYRRVDLLQIADDWTDLVDGTLDGTFNVDEFGGTQNTFIWTNTTIGGFTEGTSSCGDWTSSTGVGRRGATNSTMSLSVAGDLACSFNSRLACFEQ